MRSLYFKLSLWSLLTLVVCVAAIVFTASALNRNFAMRGGPYGRTIQWQVESARREFLRGGAPALKRYMEELGRFFPEPHYLVDANGKDLIGGEDRSALLRGMPGGVFPPPLPGRLLRIVRAAAAGDVILIVELDPPFGNANLLPYLSAVLVAIGIFSYALFRYLVSPLRQLSVAVERFGQGDFSARVAIRRRDEFGDVASQFNDMAGRIETLLAAERRLLEDVSHELRSPLTRLQFALETVRTAVDREAAVQKMRREIDRLAKLVGELLEVTRAEGDPEARQRETLDLTELVGEIVSDCQIEAEAKGCGLAWTRPGGIRMEADAELLRRALENVLRNAIRHAPEQSNIEVSLRRDASGVVYEVRDRGEGVPVEMLERIFQPFFRVDTSRTAATGGVGLGLSIAKRAVALHRGVVIAENAEPGLRVRITLPEG